MIYWVLVENDAEWCNGSTADSDSVSRGSNPFSVVFLCEETNTIYITECGSVW